MKTNKILIFGAGGFAREVAWLINRCNDTNKQYEILGFIDDTGEQTGKKINDINVFGLDEASMNFPDTHIVVAIGNPKDRESVVKKSENKGFKFESILHPKAEMSKWIGIGLGTVICAGNILTTNIEIGKHVLINLNCTIGHDVIIGDYTTLAPGVHISGWVNTGKRVYIGTGAVIINGNKNNPIIIEDDVIIGAGACVTRSLRSKQTYVGVPAKSLRRNNS